VGRLGRVLQTVTETDGRVKLAGETWSARVPHGGEICQPGQEVRVLSIEGATVIVSGVTAGQKSE
jgi:membrane protein implicated in regulation of membrane protease activity